LNQEDKETARIRDAALKRALSMPHKPHKVAAKKKKAKRKGKATGP